MKWKESYFGKSEGEKEEYKEMWAIVDTGCEKSVVGEK